MIVDVGGVLALVDVHTVEKILVDVDHEEGRKSRQLSLSSNLGVAVPVVIIAIGTVLSVEQDVAVIKK